MTSPISGRTSGPRPSTIAPHQERGASARVQRARTKSTVPIHAIVRPFSSPLDENFHVGAIAMSTIVPAGTSTSVPVRRCRTAAPTPSIVSPNSVSTIPVRTAIHSSRSGRTTSAAVRTATQRGLVAASTRSPTLKTGPCPLVMLWTMRRLMKPSSDIQRYCHAAIASSSTGSAIAATVNRRRVVSLIRGTARGRRRRRRGRRCSRRRAGSVLVHRRAAVAVVGAHAPGDEQAGEDGERRDAEGEDHPPVVPRVDGPHPPAERGDGHEERDAGPVPGEQRALRREAVVVLVDRLGHRARHSVLERAEDDRDHAPPPRSRWRGPAASASGGAPHPDAGRSRCAARTGSS